MAEKFSLWMLVAACGKIPFLSARRKTVHTEDGSYDHHKG